jgi:hypothetical protein
MSVVLLQSIVSARQADKRWSIARSIVKNDLVKKRASADALSQFARRTVESALQVAHRWPVTIRLCPIWKKSGILRSVHASRAICPMAC